MLPDLLHGKLDARARARVEAHVASCEDCAEDLEVLRTVKSAAVFIPAIDVDRVVRQIPPYRGIVPAAQVPARSRVVSWLVAASLAVVVLGGGSLLMIQQKPLPQRVVDGPDQRGPAPRPQPTKRVATAGQKPPVMLESRPHALAMATGVDGLSDNNLRQLMNDMDSFDALPTTEPEPVISVDNGDGVDQSIR
jgi:hypothetical protein